MIYDLPERAIVTVIELVQQYRAEKVAIRTDTRRFYEVWLSNHLMPGWGLFAHDVQARPVEFG